MTAAGIAYLITGALALSLGIAFVITSIRESERRAALVSALVCLLLSAAWSGWYAGFSSRPAILILPAAAVWLAALLFFCPTGRARGLRILELGERVDERDVIFSREEYEPGTDRYEEYYRRRPENKAIDDRIRSLPPLLSPGGRYYHPEDSHRVAQIFSVIEDLASRVDGPVATERSGIPPDEASAKSYAIPPDEASAKVKSLVLGLGADVVGIAPLDPAFLYTHVGRGPEPYGRPIETSHTHAIVFGMEMRPAAVRQAPRLPITEESALQYLRGAQISVTAAAVLREWGWSARAHTAGSNYQVILPPLAHSAGLGELSRMGYLISRPYGPRLRLGVVTTDLELVHDQPDCFGVQEFCGICRKCADACPSGAIPREGKTVVRGVEKWMLRTEQCIRYWRTAGTDCGLCMKVCPFSHPKAMVHDLVRLGLRRSALARVVSVWGDDLLYGRGRQGSQRSSPRSGTG